MPKEYTWMSCCRVTMETQATIHAQLCLYAYRSVFVFTFMLKLLLVLYMKLRSLFMLVVVGQ